VLVRILHTLVEIHLIFVLRSSGRRIAPRPEEGDEGLGIVVGLDLIPPGELVGGHDELDRALGPVAILRRELCERSAADDRQQRADDQNSGHVFHSDSSCKDLKLCLRRKQR
jgi:hypothetical protein